MQQNNPIFDDLARVASGALNALGGVREEAETRMKDLFRRVLGEMDLVTREEFDIVQTMAQKAREENEALKTRIDALEAAARTKPAKKPAAAAAPKPAMESPIDP